jgi:hypothetical protein
MSLLEYLLKVLIQRLLLEILSNSLGRFGLRLKKLKENCSQFLYLCRQAEIEKEEDKIFWWLCCKDIDRECC